MNSIDNIYNRQFSFKAMKPNQFQGIDYAVVRKFKAPVEKFNSNADFQQWAKKQLQTYLDHDYTSNIYYTCFERSFLLRKWKDLLTLKDELWSNAKKLLVFSAIVKDLKNNNDDLPPIINEAVLDKTFDTLENDLKKDKDMPFDFNKRYKEEFVKKVFADVPSNYTGWLVIPSKKNCEEGFIDNIEKVKLLSKDTWCTKKWHYAESYLKSGDFHFYLEKGRPKLGLRFAGSEIQEVQGEKNNSLIPKECLPILKKHLSEGNYFLNEEVMFLIEKSERA